MIFISHTTKNIKQAKKIYNSLQSAGLSLWFAEKEIKSGENYAAKISQAVKNSSCLVLVYSADVDDSMHVQKELDLATKYKKKIYPLRISDDEPKEAMEYFLSAIQYIDVFNNYEKEMKNFILFLKDELGLKEDTTDMLDSRSIKNFCIQHFKKMGYNIEPNNSTTWQKVPEVKTLLNKKPEQKEKLLHYLMDECIYCSKDGVKPIIASPKYLESITVPYFKAYEAELFWNIRHFIWEENDYEKACQKLHIDVNADDVDFKKKSSLVDAYRSLSFSSKKFSVLFYMFVQEVPVYNFQKNYSLPFEGTYEQNEQMPNLYLDYTYISNWWAYKKDDIESIPGKRYIGFSKAYEKLRYDFKGNSHITYENYNGRIAETLAEVFLKRNDLVVQNFGAESILGNSISFMKRSETLEDDHAADTIRKYMTSPDLLVIKLNEQNQIINSYMIDVKYRSFKSKEIFLKELKYGELYKQAKKYSQIWDHMYLLLFLHLKESIEIYLLPVKDVMKKEYEPVLLEDDTSFGWLKNDELDLLYKQAKNYWLN